MEALELPGLRYLNDINSQAIVSVWAQRDGRAIIWQRLGQKVQLRHERFRPWVYARRLDDLQQLGSRLGPESAPKALVHYQELSGPDPAYRYLLSANDGRLLERSLLQGASQRLGRTVSSLYELEEEYYQVGPVEQFLMASGHSYFRGMVFSDLHRLQFDLETTALDPKQGRIFLIAVRDSSGFEAVLEAPTPADEGPMIRQLCQIIAERDPDVIENHNLFGFDLPFLTARADALGVKLPLGRAP
jgi:DNA polymerase I